MDDERIYDAIDKHLSALADQFKYASLVAIVFLIAGLQASSEFEVVGIKIPRHSAFFSAFLISLVIQLLILDKLLRIRQLFSSINSQFFVEACKRIGLHAWSANPFAFFGDSLSIILPAAKSFGVIVFAYVLFNSWLLTFSGRRSGIVGVVAPFVLLGVSFAAIMLIAYIRKDIYKRMLLIDPDFAQKIALYMRVGRYWILLFGVIGLFFCLWILVGGQIV